jgi:hypothetical protein
MVERQSSSSFSPISHRQSLYPPWTNIAKKMIPVYLLSRLKPIQFLVSSGSALKDLPPTRANTRRANSLRKASKKEEMFNTP